MEINKRTQKAVHDGLSVRRVQLEDKTNLELQIFVNPGTVTENFEEFKRMVSHELETKYKNIEVSEESIKEAREARARLNKTKTALEEMFRSAKRQNEKPLEISKKRAEELKALLDDAINTIDIQIKQIEQRRRDEKYIKALEIYKEVFSDVPADVRQFADRCSWICKAEWANSTYSDKKVREDCSKAKDEILSALQVLTGEFAPQMLQDFIQFGSLAKAQIEGGRLQKAKEDHEALLARQKEQKTTPPPEVKAEESLSYSSFKDPITVNSPTFYRTSPSDDRVGTVDMRLKGHLFQFKWLKAVCKTEGIELSIINKENKE